MRILVTGGAGFIGSNFVHYVLDEYEDDEVITLDALTYAGSKANLEGALDDPRHEFVEGDIRDHSLVADLVADVDAVVNFAAESHVDRSIESAKPFVMTNVQGTQTLLDAAKGAEIERFLQILDRRSVRPDSRWELFRERSSQSTESLFSDKGRC